MSEANQTAPTDAREASMSRVTTLDKLVPAPADPPKSDPEVKTEEKQDEGQKPKKKLFSERMQEVIADRKAAEEEAAAAKREAAELRARLESLQVKAEPVDAGAKPQRSQFQSDDEYVEALTDWKAKEAIAAREKQQAEAQAKAEFESVTKQWEQRCVDAKKDIEDFEEVIAASDVQVSDVVSQALMRSENGPQIAYFFAKHPDEAKKVSRMHPIDAVRYIDKLERDLSDDAPAKPVQRSKAPEPINPVKSSPALAQGPAESFEEHRARRKAQQASRR